MRERFAEARKGRTFTNRERSTTAQILRLRKILDRQSTRLDGCARRGLSTIVHDDNATQGLWDFSQRCEEPREQGGTPVGRHDCDDDRCDHVLVAAIPCCMAAGNTPRAMSVSMCPRISGQA